MAHKKALIFIVAWLIPTLALGLFWKATYGVFSITRPGIGLNLWEGLGEYPNPWMISTSDDAATKLLTANGLIYGSSQGDAFLADEYLRDVRDDPGIVFGQVLQRFRRVVIVEQADWGIHQFAVEVLMVPLLVLLAVLGFYRGRRCLLVPFVGALWLSRVIPFSIMHEEPRYVLPLLIVYIVGTALLFGKRQKVEKAFLIDRTP